MNQSTLNRRQFLRNGSLALAATAYTPKIVFPKDDIQIGHGAYRYRVVPGWGVLDAGKNPVNNCHEMVEDAKGRLILLTDEVKNNVLIYDKSGKLLDSWGTTYPGAHGLTLANEGGEQFLYITAVNRRQVIKTDLKGREIMKLDYPKETGKYDHPDQFSPTETAINPTNGDIYVADGYGANYITRYDAKGRYISHFGGRGASLTDQFDCCHGVLVDTRNRANPTLLVTDRRRNALKRFTLDGKYISTIALPGSYICRPVIKGDMLYGAVFRSTSDAYPDSGYIQILDKNDKVISTPGGSAPTYANGKLEEQRKQDPDKVFMHPHDVCVDSDDNIYVPQWNSKNTYPVKLERVG